MAKYILKKEWTLGSKTGVTYFEEFTDHVHSTDQKDKAKVFSTKKEAEAAKKQFGESEIETL